MQRYRLIVQHDEFSDNPLNDTDDWKLTRFRDGQQAAECFRPVSRDEVPGQHMLPFVLVPKDAALRRAFKQQRAWIVSCYRHSGEYWFIPQARKANGGFPYFQHEEWDTIHVAGILQWVGDSSDFPRKHADRLKWAHEALTEFNQWISGDVWEYRVLDEYGECIDGCCGFYGVDAVVADVRGGYPEFFDASGRLLPVIQAKENVREMFT